MKKYKKLLLLALLVVTAIIFFIVKTSTAPKSIDYEMRHEVKVLPPVIKEKYIKEVKIASPEATFRVPVLMFHYVEYVKDKGDKIRQQLATSPYTFEHEILTLQDAGYTFMKMSEIGEVLNGTKDMPSKPVVLTFDDGYRDFYTDVFPILKKYNIKATAYIIPGFTGGQNYMTLDQLQEIASTSANLIDIGAHTVHHAYLKNMSLSKATTEVTESKQMLESELHIPVVSFAYPYGAFDEQAIQIVKDAGFTTSVSTVPGISLNQANRFFIFRLRSGGRTGQNFLNFLEQTPFKL